MKSFEASSKLLCILMICVVQVQSQVGLLDATMFTYWVDDSCLQIWRGKFQEAMLGARSMAGLARNKLIQEEDTYSNTVFRRIFKADPLRDRDTRNHVVCTDHGRRHSYSADGK